MEPVRTGQTFYPEIGAAPAPSTPWDDSYLTADEARAACEVTR